MKLHIWEHSLTIRLQQSNEDNAKGDWLKKVHQMVRDVKRDEEVSLEYMKIFEREEMVREEGRELQMRDLVQKKLDKGKTAQEIADELEESVEAIESIIGRFIV